MPRITTVTSRMVLTREIAFAAGQDAACAQMRKAGRMKWNAADRDLATVKTNRLLLYVPFALGGLDGMSLPLSHYEDMGLTLAEVLASGNAPAGHNGAAYLAFAA